MSRFNHLFWFYMCGSFVIAVVIVYILYVLLRSFYGRSFNSPEVTRQPRIFVMSRSTIVARPQPGPGSTGPRQLPVIHTQAYPQEPYAPPMYEYPKQEGSQHMPSAPPTYDEVVNPSVPNQTAQRTAAS